MDVLGLCAFSVAGVLADGVLTLDEVARAVLPEPLRWPGAERPADAVLALGAHAIGAYQALDESAPFSGAPSGAEWSGWQEACDEYFRLRAPIQRVAPGEPRRWPQGWGTAAFGRPPAFVCQPDCAPIRVAERAAQQPPGKTAHPASLPTEITVSCGRTLAVKIPSPVHLSFPAPPTGLELLQALAAQYPQARDWLLREGRPIPALVVDGAAQNPDQSLPANAVVELVLAISGG